MFFMVLSGVCYIGQTRSNITSRMEEHNPKAKISYKTDVTKHFLAYHSEHSLAFEHNYFSISFKVEKDIDERHYFNSIA